MLPMGGTTLKTLGVCTALVTGAIYWHYGTLSPCDALRQTVRRQDGLARVLPNAVVDLAIEAQYGPMSPGRCLGALINGQPVPASAPVVVMGPAPPVSADQTNSTAIQAAGNEMVAAINECRAKRLAGELQSFTASAQCAGPRIIQAYRKANYRYLDLVSLMVAKRLQISERLDRKEISEADANVALQQAFSDTITAEKARDAMRK
jgi:hypothetical protein